MNSTKKVLLAGASGLVGQHLLRLLSSDSGIAEVRALTRRPLTGLGSAAEAGRVQSVVADFERLEEWKPAFAVDAVCCALGTTIRSAGSQQAFRRVDFDYPLQIARLARAQGARHFLLVSAAGADARSRIFYNRVKGELEQALGALGYPSLTIAQPSLLLGDRSEHRAGEEWGKRLAWLIPAPWKPVQAAQVAAGLVQALHNPASGVAVLDNRSLRAMSVAA